MRHLETAIKDPRNKNIALTGRYGSGKSSILDDFFEGQTEQKKPLHISINAPGEDEELTNRIQKEVSRPVNRRCGPR